MKKSLSSICLVASMLMMLAVVSCGGGSSDGGSNPPTYNLTGTWDVTETTGDNTCEAPVGVERNLVITIVHPDGSNSMTATEISSNETINLKVSGDKVTASLSGGSDSCPQGLTQSWDVTASSASYMSGTNSWTCKYDGGSCTGTNDIVATKQGSVSPATPTITGFNPTSGAVGTAITITGTNFSTTAANNTVKFNGTAATVASSTATSITTSVPTGATTGPITVTVGGQTATSATDFSVISVTEPTPPTITSFSPTSGGVGTAVTITGMGFSTPAVNNTVTFNGTTATVTNSTATSITTSVPAGATTGPITVTVGGQTATSATNFTVIATPPGGGTSEQEPNDDPASAQSITLNEAINGTTSSDSDPDWYSINLSTAGNYTIQITFGSTADMDLYLTDSVGNLLNYSVAGVYGGTETITQWVNSSGTYYILVVPYALSATTSYTLTVQLQ